MMSSELKVYRWNEPFVLESGRTVHGLKLAYHTLGRLNAAGDNVVWIFHALTANSNPAEWWPGLVGEGKFFDPGKFFIVCVNMPGSCYGSTGPLDTDEQTGKPYYHDFPWFTTRDMIRAYRPLREHLGIKKIFLGIGGSMGGQQLLEWAVEEPELFEHIVPIATNAFHSPWGIAFNTSQRMAIEADATWALRQPDAGLAGMKAARSVALLSYRHYETYGISQPEEDINKTDGFKSESYQQYQGEKLAKRFNAFSYYFLTKSMDAHHVGRGRGSAEAALSRIKAKAAVIGIENDVLFPISEQAFLAEHIRYAKLYTIRSFYGHDGFLLEYEQLSEILENFLVTQNIIKN
ncbi:MAG: homoserine O-acetyltransferase [Chitinophagaceae bacterium]|nr:homoserine O-acetyltransferase [Chitinophagaceae bacterium]